MFRNGALISRTLATAAAALTALLATAQVAVTTYHNDNLRTGLNSSETTLTTSNVNSNTFGLLFSLPVDGQVYAQPLYMPGVTVPNKGTHNILYVATEHNSVYAFDADSNLGGNSVPLWKINFGPSVPNGETGTDDINPECGITGTPTISPVYADGQFLFVVSKTKTVVSNNNVYTLQLHAINIATGKERVGSPMKIAGRFPGTGEGNDGAGFVNFNSLIQHNRAALLLVPAPVSGVPTNKDLLFVTFASHGDNGPYHGWIFIYDANAMKLLGLWNTTPNALNDPSGYPIAAGGVWQGGYGPASDGTSTYFSTGNGWYDPKSRAFGDSIIRFNHNPLGLSDWFTPSDQLNLDDTDADLGSGGVMLLPDTVSGTSKKHWMVQCGKEGTVYLVRRDYLTGGNPVDKVQELTHAIGGVWGGPAFFNNTVYYGPVGSSIVALPIANGAFSTSGPSMFTQDGFGYPGPTPSISSNGNTNGIVWAIDAGGYNDTGRVGLRAYDALNLQTELYNSANTSGRDDLGFPVKFTTPTIVNGKVYVPAEGVVGVYGLGTWTANPIITPAGGAYHGSVQISVTDTTPNAHIYYTLDGSNPTQSSTLYTVPLTLAASAAFKCRAYSLNNGPSAVEENDYLLNAVIGNGTGLTGSYYDGIQDPAGTPTAQEVDPTINFNWNGNSPIAGVGGSNWAGEWDGTIQAETTGTYTLTTASDDGVRLYISNNLLIDDYNYHGTTFDSATIAMTAGTKYPIKIKFFQGSGGSVLQLFWATPGLSQQIVPQSQLYPLLTGRP